MLLAALLALLDEAAPEFTLKDLAGRDVALASFKDRKAVVLVFTGIECPRGRAAEPRLADYARTYGERGVAFLAINANRNESDAEIAEHVKKTAWPLPVLRDPGGKVAELYKVDVQPAAIVLSEGRVRYRGLIDDHKVEEFVRTHYLRDALDAALAGKEPAVKETQAVGCSIKKTEAAAAGEVTYAKDVAPILNKHCVACHRPGQVGPFTLDDFDQASAWSKEITTYTKRRAMPPWKPTTNAGIYYNERRLTDAELAVLERWHAAGAPKGDVKHLPPAPKFDDGWMLGTPDVVLKAEGGHVVGPKGPDEYRCYVVKNPFDEDKWVTGIEYRPGNGLAVHHIIGFLDKSDQSEKKDAAEEGPGYRSNGSGPGILPSGSLGGWAPGNLPRMLPDGTARLWAKGERIVLETHYHRTGRPETDAGAQIAFHFAKTPVKKRLHVGTIANFLLKIPADADRHKVSALWIVPKNVSALDVMPHMHLLGREISVVATLPDGTKRDLVDIKDWDFNWQETYQFRENIQLPRGTRVWLHAVYDNSLKNSNNPSIPPKTVRWGENTTDEMCVAFVHFTNDNEDLTQPQEER
ncbi:MAG TPA: redoxin domain-containing protein [Planctomycetota bacterium]